MTNNAPQNRTRLFIVATAAIVLLLAGPVLLVADQSQAQSAVTVPRGAIDSVVADLFESVPVDRLALQVTCQGGAISADANSKSFHFEETDEPATTPPIFPGGYGATGCAQAVYTASVPKGTDHVHVRFWATRGIGEFGVGGFPVHASIAFNQSVDVYLGNATQPLATYAFFGETESERQRTFISIPTVYLPPEATDLRIVWSFEDRGVIVAPQTQDAPQGVAYSSSVDTPILEFSSVPLPVLSIDDTESRNGRALIHQYATRFEAPADLMAKYSVDLRLRVQQEQQFQSFVAPNGTVFERLGTRIGDGTDGFDRSRVLQENPANDPVSQITIPTLLSARFGPGVYEVRTAHTELLFPTPGLIPVAIIVLALPLPFGMAAYWRVRGFEKEAFGAFRRAAVRLRFALIAIAVYYAAVVFSAWPGQRLAAMVILPLSADGWFLYGQVIVAIAAFVTLYAVARELFSITRPREPSDS